MRRANWRNRDVTEHRAAAPPMAPTFTVGASYVYDMEASLA